MAKKEIAVKTYGVKLIAEERDRLEAMVRAGKNSAQSVTRAGIPVKADVSDAGDGWSDSAIAAALDTSINNVARTRQQLVEEGFETTLKRKDRWLPWPASVHPFSESHADRANKPDVVVSNVRTSCSTAAPC